MVRVVLAALAFHIDRHFRRKSRATLRELEFGSLVELTDCDGRVIRESRGTARRSCAAAMGLDGIRWASNMPKKKSEKKKNKTMKNRHHCRQDRRERWIRRGVIRFLILKKKKVGTGRTSLTDTNSSSSGVAATFTRVVQSSLRSGRDRRRP